jgi:TonB-dependent starch-binding outer membrane protein SusC
MKRSLLLRPVWVKFVGITFFQLAMISLPSLESTAASTTVFFQQVKVTGTVTDESGTPLPGVGVRIKGSNAGAATDATGKYSINIPDGTVTLVFSYIGYTPQEMAVNNRTTLNVRLVAQETSLNAVVVVGYGTQKRERVTTAIASVRSENFVKGAVQDAAQLVRGKVAGLNVITPDANPTSTAQINLRGITTLTSGTSPLVLIDGVPGTLTTVAPEDIESIDVLKDGSAAAIYGTRGTNGVILITTRKVNGETPATIDVNSYVTTQKITKRLDFMNAAEYRQLVAQGKPGAFDYGADTDWLNEITRTPISQVYNISLRGGSQNTSYIANLNYRSMEGLILRSDNKMLYPRLEVNHRMFGGKLRLNANLSGYQQTFFAGTDGNSYRGDVYRNGLTYNPTDPVKDENGKWTEHTDKTAYANPVSLLMETEGKNQNTNLRTLGTITYSPIKGLDLMLLGSRDQVNSVRGYYESKRHYSTLRDGRNGFASRGTTRSEENLLELTANYQKTINDHDLTALAGYSWRETSYQDYWMQNWDFPTDDFSYNNMGAGLALARGEAPQNSYQSRNKLIGYFFRINYSFQNKYLLMASIRREGSSKFGQNNKYGNFPAISAGWNIKNENFLQDAKVLSALKLRGGYGITGTEPNSPYMSLNRLNFDTYALVNGQWIQVVNPSTNANPDLRWEKKEESNIGVDYGLWNNRISGSLELYRRVTRDLLMDYSVPTPPYLYNTIRANAASMENKGIEFILNFAAIDKKDLKWNTSVNYSTNRNKLLSLSDKKFQLAAGFFDAGTTEEPIQQPLARIKIGEPIGNFWGFRSVDIDDRGYWIIEGKDGKPKPIADQQADDKQIIGNGLPKHYLNFNNSLSYKDFDLNVTMRGAFGFQILNTPRMFYAAPVMLTRGNLLRSAYDNVYGKRPLADDQSLNYLSYYIEQGDYWKIDNVTIGYNIRLKNIAIKALRVYASGSNLITFTKYSGVDPEVGVTGLTPGVDDRNRYPATSTFTLGASFTL